jgi:DNA-binding protein YbaB
MNMMDLFGKLREVQAKMKEAQENLVNVTATGEGRGRHGKSEGEWIERGNIT